MLAALLYMLAVSLQAQGRRKASAQLIIDGLRASSGEAASGGVDESTLGEVGLADGADAEGSKGDQAAVGRSWGPGLGPARPAERGLLPHGGSASPAPGHGEGAGPVLPFTPVSASALPQGGDGGEPDTIPFKPISTSPLPQGGEEPDTYPSKLISTRPEPPGKPPLHGGRSIGTLEIDATGSHDDGLPRGLGKQGDEDVPETLAFAKVAKNAGWQTRTGVASNATVRCSDRPAGSSCLDGGCRCALYEDCFGSTHGTCGPSVLTMVLFSLVLIGASVLAMIKCRLLTLDEESFADLFGEERATMEARKRGIVIKRTDSSLAGAPPRWM